MVGQGEQQAVRAEVVVAEVEHLKLLRTELTMLGQLKRRRLQRYPTRLT